MKRTILLLSVIISSCSTYIPYTDRIKQDLSNNSIGVEQTQFYFMKKITLERVANNTVITSKKGNISREKERVRDVINFGYPIKKLMAVGTNLNGSIAVAFEPDKYIKLQKEKEYYYFGYDNNTVLYDTEIYNITMGSNQKLFIKKKDFVKYKRNSRTVKGLKVN